jgi:endonuclease/exonuclease/phosphatase family metal-dependent hydrolase
VELAGVLAGAKGRTILVGDLNSRPGTEGHLVMTEAGFRDAWSELHLEEPAAPGDEGMTCCFPELLFEDGLLGERIDFVLVRGRLDPVRAKVVGDEDEDRIEIGGLRYWPSDHAGVVATLALDERRRGRRHHDDRPGGDGGHGR